MVPSNGTRPSSALRVTSTVVSRSCAALPRAWHGISDLDGNRKDSHGYGGYGPWELPRIPETFSTKYGGDGGVMNVMIAIRFDDFTAFQLNL